MIEEEIKKKSQIIAEILKKGCDVELRKSKDGITVHKIDRKKVG